MENEIKRIILEIKENIEISKEDLLEEFTQEINRKFNLLNEVGSDINSDGSNIVGSNLGILLDFATQKSIRTRNMLMNSLNSLEEKVKKFDALKVIYGRQSLNGVNDFLLSEFEEELESIRWYTGFLNPLGKLSFPEGVSASYNSTKQTFSLVVKKEELENDSTFFEIPADNAYTIKPYLKINKDLLEDIEDPLDPEEGTPLSDFYFNFATALHNTMPIARLYEGDIKKEVANPTTNQIVEYAWSLAEEVVLTFKVRFAFDPNRLRNIDTRQEIVNKFNSLLEEFNYDTIGKSINLQDFSTLVEVAGVAKVYISYSSSDPSLVADQSYTADNKIISIPPQVYLTCKLDRDDVEVVNID